MSQALANLHFEMGFHSPFHDQVEAGLCAAIDKTTPLDGGWLCEHRGKQFVVGNREYQCLVDAFGDYHSAEALIGLGRRYSLI